MVKDDDTFEDVRYLLTFRPFESLPSLLKKRYFDGSTILLPAPFSLIFWGVPQVPVPDEKLAMHIQTPLLSLVRRHEGPAGIRIPQSGWFHEPVRKDEVSLVAEELLLNFYHRTSRWDKISRNEDDMAKSLHLDRMTETLFSTELSSLDLYNKPMARNCQIWEGNWPVASGRTGCRQNDDQKCIGSSPPRRGIPLQVYVPCHAGREI